jgi:hypothetical protein
LLDGAAWFPFFFPSTSFGEGECLDSVSFILQVVACWEIETFWANNFIGKKAIGAVVDSDWKGRKG